MHFPYIISTYIIWKFFENEEANVSWQRHVNDFSRIADTGCCTLRFNTSLPVPGASTPPGSRNTLIAEAPYGLLELLNRSKRQ